MGLGIPKIHEETIAEELGDVPVIAVNHLGTGGLVRMHHITIVFRIELRCQYSGVGEVDKHHGQLTAFGCLAFPALVPPIMTQIWQEGKPNPPRRRVADVCEAGLCLTNGVE